MDELTKKKALKDQLCKRLLSLVDVVSKIMESCVLEYKGLSKKEIVDCLDIDSTNKRFIKTLPTDDISVFDNIIKYDVLFEARLPNSNKHIPMLINLEAQNSSDLPYELIRRSIYYASRLLSRQKPDYENLKKVYSIWICVAPKKEKRNTINRYVVKELNEVGNYLEDKENYDLIEVIMLNLGTDYDYTKDDLNILELLKLMLTKTDLNAFGITKTLNKFDIILNKEEAIEMCTVSEGIYQEGIAEGKIQGLAIGEQRGLAIGEQRGLAIGKKEGLAIGEQRGILTAVSRLIENGMTFDEASKALRLTKKEKEEYLNSKKA